MFQTSWDRQGSKIQSNLIKNICLEQPAGKKVKLVTGDRITIGYEECILKSLITSKHLFCDTHNCIKDIKNAQ